MKTYIESLEESNKELSRRLAVAENYIAWKDSHKRLRFLYVLHFYANKPCNCNKSISRSDLTKYLDIFKKSGNNKLIRYIEVDYGVGIERIVLLLCAFHEKESFNINRTLVYKKVLVDISKKDIKS